MKEENEKLDDFKEAYFEFRQDSMVSSFEFYQNELRKLLKPYDTEKGCERDEYLFSVIDGRKDVIPAFDFVKEMQKYSLILSSQYCCR